MASGSTPKYKLDDFRGRRIAGPLPNTRYKSETVERVSQLNGFNFRFPQQQVEVTAPPTPLSVVRRTIISRYEDLLSSKVDLGIVLSIDPDLQKIFDVDSDPRDSSLASSRLVGLEVPRILGVGKILTAVYSYFSAC